MWTIMSRVGQLVGLVSPEPPIDLDAIAAVLDADDPVADEEDYAEPNLSEESGVRCQHRVGVVTALHDEHGYIRLSDENEATELFFKRQNGPAELKVGNSVVFLVYKRPGDSEWVVRKILYVQNDYWDKNNDESEEKIDANASAFKEECETAYKCVMAKVSGRQDRTVVAGQFQFDLDSVVIDFMPVEGDWLMLESLVKQDQEEQTDTVLVVERVGAVRSRDAEGTVTHWSQETEQGIVAGEAVFHKHCCQPGYLPRVGDKVRMICIESEQGQLTWRAVSVAPLGPTSRPLPSTHDSTRLTELLRDKEGVHVSEDTNTGPMSLATEKFITIEVQNTGESMQTLLEVELSPDGSQVELVTPFSNPQLLPTDKQLQFTFKVKARFVGRSTEMVVFKFEGFEIGRHIAIDVQSTAVNAALASQNIGTQRTTNQTITAQKLLATRNGFVLPGRRPIKPANFVPVNLGMFVVPEALVKLVLGFDSSARREEVIASLEERYRYLSEPCNATNYVLRWDLLVHLEEIESSVNIARYNTTASLHRVQDYLSLEIPGLCERRPSLLVGDRVVARGAWTDQNSWNTDSNTVAYEGYIHKVLSNEVLLKFTASFHDSCCGVYSLCFEGNRTCFRREHQAVHLAMRNLGPDWLFPSKITYQQPQIVIIEEEDYVYPVRSTEEVESVINNDKTPETETEAAEYIQVDGDNTQQENVVSVSETLKAVTEDEQVANDIQVNNEDKQYEVQVPEHNVILTAENCKTENNTTDVENKVDTSILNKHKQDCKNGEINATKSVERRIKVSDMFEKFAQPKEDSQQKISPPRVPVVARFLQNGNSPSAVKSPNEVKSVLQHLASFSPSEKLKAENKSMKTLEEIEKSILNFSIDNHILDGIKPTSESTKQKCDQEPKKSPFEAFLEGNNINKGDNILNNTINCEESIKNFASKPTVNKIEQEKNVKNNSNVLKKESHNREETVQWNSNTQLKMGDEKEAYYKVPINKRRKLTWFNPRLNHYQKEAVRNILRGEARPLPYVIFGPPGTGKTITLVETVLQIYTLIPESRLLIGTPSNSSADLMCERLLDSGLLAPGELLRLVGFHYVEQGRVPERLKPYCGSADIKARDDQSDPAPVQEGVVNISRHAIGRHRITVGTCNTLAVLYQMGFPRGHFTHVLIDEAGQATEPEILIPLVFLHSSYGQAVLAGDPLQLGPVVLSRVASHFGLSNSLLSRLLRRTPYAQDGVSGYNPRLVTQLLYNYRSLPAILSLPNNMFYDGKLVAQVSEESSEEALWLQSLQLVLPITFPMMFHGVRGTNCQAIDSPSWYNPHEVLQCVLYLQTLYTAGLTPEQCGIISPYQAQVLKIRQMLETLEIPAPKVGSVEEFQGQERMAIILSTVRSSPRLIDSDVKHSVGFLASPQRLNVAITRARAVLIILGNPHLLARDQYWRSVLEYCVRGGGYTGCDRPSLE